MSTSQDTRKPWQRRTWVSVLAILLGYTLPLMVYITQLGGEPATTTGYLFYSIVYTLIVIVVLLLLLWFLCGEKPKVLNLRPSAWWKDLLGGMVLVGLTLSLKYILDPTIARYFYRASDRESGIGGLVNTLAGNPWLCALFLGPI